MVDIKIYRSHPDKSLVSHTQGVLDGVKLLTDLKIAEWSAIFHDIGKLNPNFQNKILGDNNIDGYANHSYISAYSFLCYCAENKKEVLKILENKNEWLGSILTIISHHHGDLPDIKNILNDDEVFKLIKFLESNPDLPASSLVEQFIPHNKFSLSEEKNKYFIKDNWPYQLVKTISSPVDYFWDTRFAFASLILADKSDAIGIERKIRENIHVFCSEYTNKLQNYINKLSKGTKLNKIRTLMREKATENINNGLDNGNRIFSLTAPTGSGKTIMLLSLASEIIKKKGEHRIIYSLPYLSITEQVETVCNECFTGLEKYIHRIDSKSENPDFEKYQNLLDNNPEAMKEFLLIQFAEDTFDYPFIITTFVRLFETLVSNKNATLLKLPNFSKAIFLIDEIQTLPPRLYGFFIVMLDIFCRKFDSYVISSSATMPNFELPSNNKHNLKAIFKDYQLPYELLSHDFFQESVFNRYEVNNITKPIEIKELADKIVHENKSLMVILNTIRDTEDLFRELLSRNIKFGIELLTTHFTINDRKEKIKKCKERKKKKIILISTQLIEAGVDIDFPIVYRDVCPIPSIVQSAGRCNRNGKSKIKGEMIVFSLQKDGRQRASSIYRGKDSMFLDYALKNISNGLKEPDLFNIQKNSFDFIQKNTLFAMHNVHNEELDLIQLLEEVSFDEIGKLRLIDEKEYGEERRYYIVQNKSDNMFEELVDLYNKLKKIDFNNYQTRKILIIQIENHLKKMSSNMVRIRLRINDVEPLSEQICCGIVKLSMEYYNNKFGIRLSNENQII